MKAAYTKSDILWKNLGKSEMSSSIKVFLSFVVILLLSLLVLTPTVVLDIAAQVGNWTYTTKFVVAYFNPFAVILVNFTIIPVLITLFIESSGLHQRSNEIIQTTKQVHFFMLINVLVLPFTEIGSATMLFKEFGSTDGVLNVTKSLSKNILSHQYPWMRMVIHMAFISNAFAMTDLPHQISVFFFKKIHAYKQRDSTYKSDFQDNFVFDIPYFQSYSLVIFFGCMLFSSLVPLVTFYGLVFFTLKYLIDKYNLVFQYYNKSESGGLMRGVVRRYVSIYVILYSVVITFFFYFNFQGWYHILGISILAFWALVMLLFRKVIEPSTRYKELIGVVNELYEKGIRQSVTL